MLPVSVVGGTRKKKHIMLHINILNGCSKYVYIADYYILHTMWLMVGRLVGLFTYCTKIMSVFSTLFSKVKFSKRSKNIKLKQDKLKRNH